jgi:hypothetical protein
MKVSERRQLGCGSHRGVADLDLADDLARHIHDAHAAFFNDTSIPA